MGTILGFLADNGYGFAYRVLDAQWFGVPQRRRRVFIVGHFGGDGASQVLAVGQGSIGDSPPSRETGEIASALTRNGSGLGGGGADDNSAQAHHLIATKTGHGQWSEGIVPLRARDAKGDSHLIAFQSNAGNRLADELHYDHSPLRIGGAGGNPPAVARQGATVRRLTPTECGRLQSFPDTWTVSDSADAPEAHTIEVLRRLWMHAATKTGEGRRPGVTVALLPPEVLLAGVHGGWVSWEVAGRCAAAYRPPEGTQPWPEGFVRRLLIDAQHRPSPYRRESFEQLARELGRSLSELPLDEALAAAILRHSGVWPEASKEWLVRHACAESEAVGRSDDCAHEPIRMSGTQRYRQFGNAVCVNVAEWIGRRLVVVDSTLPA